MKNMLFASILVLMSSVSTSAKVLLCQMADLTSGRIVAEKQATLASGSSAPILLLLSSGELTGTVRDTLGVTPDERKIELQLSYQSGLGYGNSAATQTYLLSAPMKSSPVAETALEEPDFYKFVSLRCYVRAGQAGEGFQIFSTTSYENGRGSANGFCDGNMGSYCIDQVKAKAKEAAARDAQWACEMRRGRADTLFPSCYDNCSPFSIPPGAPSQMVSCSANCSVRCEIP